MNLDLKILNALKDEKEKVDLTKRFQITKGAYKKAMLYAKLVSKIAGGGMECYGYLLKDKNALDDIVTDVYLADDQEVQAAYCRVTDEGVRKASQNIEPMGYEIVGWWHSHGTFETFHSGTDVRNFRNVLHSIAPRTIFEKKEAVYQLDGTTLETDNYKIEGILSAGGKIRVIKNVKRDPFAYSFVVNVREDSYRECITKTYDHVSKEFKVNQPTLPELEILEGDVRLDVPDMEWEIYDKINMVHNPYVNSDDRIHDCEGFSTVSENFLLSALNYINEDGKYSDFIKQLIESDPDQSRFRMLIDAKEGSVEDKVKTINDILDSEDDMRWNLESGLRRSEFKRYAGNSFKLKKFELENKIFMQMMVGFYKDDLSFDASGLEKSHERKNSVIEGSVRRAELLDESCAIASDATKALTRYCMENLTDYGSRREHRYSSLMANILGNMKSNKNYSLETSVDNETRKAFSATRKYDLLLYGDRVNIFNQLVRDVYDIKSRKNVTGNRKNLLEFLQEFSKVYGSENGSAGSMADSMIEEYIIPQDVPTTEYQDSVFQEKGVKILGAEYKDPSYRKTPSYRRVSVYSGVASSHKKTPSAQERTSEPEIDTAKIRESIKESYIPPERKSYLPAYERNKPKYKWKWMSRFGRIFGVVE